MDVIGGSPILGHPKWLVSLRKRSFRKVHLIGLCPVIRPGFYILIYLVYIYNIMFTQPKYNISTLSIYIYIYYKDILGLVVPAHSLNQR